MYGDDSLASLTALRALFYQKKRREGLKALGSWASGKSLDCQVGKFLVGDSSSQQDGVTPFPNFFCPLALGLAETLRDDLSPVSVHLLSLTLSLSS